MTNQPIEFDALRSELTIQSADIAVAYQEAIEVATSVDSDLADRITYLEGRQDSFISHIREQDRRIHDLERRVAQRRGLR